MNDNTKRHDTDFSEADLDLLCALGEATGDMPQDGDTQAAWAEFAAKHRAKGRRRRAVRAAIWAAVAVAAVALVAVLMPWQRLSTSGDAVEAFTAMDVPQGVEQSERGGRVTVSTPAATVQPVVLPDGTHVLLGAGSRLEYEKDFGGRPEREVKLVGMARFDVRHDNKRPFTVHAEGLDARVLGTVFDVSTYPGASRKVTLYSGKVQVCDADGDLAETLKPGYQAVLSGKRGIRVSPADLQAAAGWSRGMFCFDNARLEDVMREVGAWYNVSVVFVSRKPLDVRVHFNIPRSMSLQQVVEALNDMGAAAFSYDGKRVCISEKR